MFYKFVSNLFVISALLLLFVFCLTILKHDECTDGKLYIEYCRVLHILGKRRTNTVTNDGSTTMHERLVGL